MRVLVSDTSVLIDLERCELLRSAFSLSAELVVPDLLFERELRDYGGQELLGLGLRVEALEAEALEQAQRYLGQQARLTLPDSFALTLAQRNHWVLLSGDAALRELARVEGVECRGVLWLVDLIEREGVAAISAIDEGLRRLASHPRCRLPRAEIVTRLERYRSILRR